MIKFYHIWTFRTYDQVLSRLEVPYVRIGYKLRIDSRETAPYRVQRTRLRYYTSCPLKRSPALIISGSHACTSVAESPVCYTGLYTRSRRPLQWRNPQCVTLDYTHVHGGHFSGGIPSVLHWIIHTSTEATSMAESPVRNTGTLVYGGQSQLEIEFP